MLSRPTRLIPGTFVLALLLTTAAHAATPSPAPVVKARSVKGVTLLPAPLPDPSGLAKNRFISLSVPTTQPVAIRVILRSLDGFEEFEGQMRWVGPPSTIPDAPPFMGAQLSPTPHYQDWSAVGLVHVTGDAIVPSSRYEVQLVAATCQNQEAACEEISTALVVATARWGDVAAPFQVPGGAPTQPNFLDIKALVDKFQNLPGAPSKVYAKLQPAQIDMSKLVDFQDIADGVGAFQQNFYPYRIKPIPPNPPPVLNVPSGPHVGYIGDLIHFEKMGSGINYEKSA